MTRRDATAGWVALAALVVAYDLYALRTDRETLSAGFARAVRHPAARWPVIAAWAYLTAHLFAGERWRSDPVRRITSRLGGSHESR